MAIWSQTVLSSVEENYGRFDAEYYKPEFLETERILYSIEGIKLRNVCSKIDVGHVGPMVRFYTDSGISLLQTQNVREFFLDLENCIKVTPEFHSKLAKSQVRKGDILIARSGSFGSAAIYLEDQIINSADIIIVELNDPRIDPLFAVTFMNTKHGSNQLVRFASGGVQGHVNLRIIEHFYLPIFEEAAQKEVSVKVQRAYDALKASAKSYQRAQHLLESELGLDKLNFKKPVGYTARFSEVISNDRVDADFYQEKYKQLDAIAGKFPIKKVKEISEKLETGIYSQSYSSEGRMYLRGVDINKGFINSESVLRTNLLLSNPKTTVAKDDILVTRVGSIGVCAIIEDDHTGSLFSDNLIRIRLNEQAKKEIIASYLNLLLNTTYGQMQMVRYSRGSVQQRLNQTQLAQIPVPIIKQESQVKIKNLLEKHRNEKKESQKLLDQAKTRVEQLIEAATER